MFRQFFQIVALVVCVIALAGCEASPPPAFRLNAVELVKQERMLLADDEHFDERYQTEIGNVLTALFGTPNEPDFPFLTGDDDPAHEMISLDNLRMAAGPVQSDHQGAPSGLYREHCAHCHGISGDGAGPTAAMLNPYPRDFRMGKFKFKSTPLRKAPTDHDLRTLLENGVPGTAMPSFRTLPEEELAALVDYVKYLTIRGEFERYLMGELAGLDGEPLVDVSLVANATPDQPASEDDVEAFEEQLYATVGEGLQEFIIDRWLGPEDDVTPIPAAPRALGLSDKGHAELVTEGQNLFFTKGNCLQCHGETGVGDGQLDTYDDWTNDWIKTPNVDPNDPATYQDFIELGALPPRPIYPRNLHLPVYRGGGHPDEIYLRLVNGIEGTPMPASTALSSDEIWALVAFVRSLPYQNSEPRSLSPPVNDSQIAR